MIGTAELDEGLKIRFVDAFVYKEGICIGDFGFFRCDLRFFAFLESI